MMFFFLFISFLYSSTLPILLFFSFFFFNDTATTEIYTLSLHDALPILIRGRPRPAPPGAGTAVRRGLRSEEHTSELQSLAYLVCRLLLEKKKNTILGDKSYKNKTQKKIKQNIEQGI